MNEQTRFNDGLKAIMALITSILSGVGAYVGLPDVVTPELLALVSSALTAVAAVYFYIRGSQQETPVVPVEPTA